MTSSKTEPGHSRQNKFLGFALSNEASSKLSEFAIQAAPWLEQNMGI
jgi:hypothetical protein